MKTTVTRPAVLCDGCEYLIDYRVPTITVVVRGEQFDFHDGGEGAAERHDCFRYWAHNPRIMQRSLKNREWDDERIDEFMALMLYREVNSTGSPGIARPEVPLILLAAGGRVNTWTSRRCLVDIDIGGPEYMRADYGECQGRLIMTEFSFHRDSSTTHLRYRCTMCRQEWDEWRPFEHDDIELLKAPA